MKNSIELQNFLSQYQTSPNTITTYKGIINRMLSSINKPISKISKEDVIKYFTSLVNKYGNISNTSMIHQTILCLFFRFVKRMDLHDSIYHSHRNPNSNPLFHIKIPERSMLDTKKLITDEEYRKLLSVINYNRDVFIIKLFHCTGMRVHEETNIKVEDYREYYDDKEKEMIYGFNILGKGRGRGKRGRFVPITRECSDLFKKYVKEKGLKTDDYLFGISVSGVQKMLKTSCEKAGIRHVTCHSFRHTFVTNMVNAGMTSLELSKITGHTVKILEDVYYHATPEIIGRGYKKYFKEES